MQPRQVARSIGSGRWFLAGAWMLTTGLVILWVTTTPNGVLRDQLRRWQFWALEMQFWLLVALSCLSMPSFLQSLEVTRRDARIAVIAAVMAFVIATVVAPKTNRIYYDEQIYQSIGQNLTDLRLAQMCNDGTLEYGSLQCWRGEYNKQPYGYPYVLSLAYRVFGARDGIASTLNTVIVACIVLVVFLLATALTGSSRAGAYASVIGALIPEQLRWGHAASAEPSAALCCAFAVLAAVAFVRLRSTAALLWTVVACAFAVQFRPECVLVVPMTALIFVIYARDELSTDRLWWVAVIGVLLITVHIGHMVAVRNEGWGTSGDRLSTVYIINNLRTNGWFYLADARFPFVYSLLGLAAVALWRRREMVVMAAYFLLFWGMFLCFYAGSYNYGADDRFSLMTYPPLAIAAGIGSWRVGEVLGRRFHAMRAATVIIAALVAQFLCYLPFVRATGEEAWAARADVAFAHAVVRDLPRNSIVLTHNPNMFHLWGQNASQVSIAVSEQGYAENVLVPRYAGGVFFHWNFWCDVADPTQQAFCRMVLERFPHSLVREYYERDYRYAIYRLDLPARHQPAP